MKTNTNNTNTRAINTDTNAETGVLTITTNAGDLTINVSELSDVIRMEATLHGLKQKIVDAAALGVGYTLTEKFTAMQEVVDRITEAEGTWNKGNRGGTGAGAKGGLLFNALCKMYPNKPIEKIRAYHDGLDAKQQSALRKSAKIAPIIEELKALAINTNGIDAGGLLDELEEM